MIEKIIQYILLMFKKIILGSELKEGNMSEEMFQELLRRLEELSAKVDDVAKKSYDKGFEDGKLQGYEEGKAQGDAEGFQRGFEEGYAKGKEDGLKECPVPVPSDKIYSQEEMDAALKPLQDKVAEQEAKINEQGAKIVELELIVSGIEQKVAEAVAAAIAEFKAKIKEHLSDVNQDLE